MPAPVLQDIDQCRPYFPGSLQDACVITVGKEPPSASKYGIETSGDADIEPLDAAAEALGVFCFDHEMEVVVLHRPVHEPKAIALTSVRKAASQGLEASLVADCTDLSANLQGHVYREASRQCRPRPVRDTGAFAVRFSASARTFAAPGAKLNLELFWPPFHLDRA